MLTKYIETSRKHQQNMFWGFLRNSWKIGSRLKNVVLSTDFELCEKNNFETLRKHQLNMFWGFLRNFWKSGSTMLKILWNTQKTPTKHALRHFKNFLKIRFLAEKSGSRLICRIMLKYHETLRKHHLNMLWSFLRNSWISGSRLKNPVILISNYAKIPWNTRVPTPYFAPQNSRNKPVR